MPVLRPLPLPRLATLRVVQRRISTQPCLRQQGLCFHSGLATLLHPDNNIYTSILIASKAVASTPPPPPATINIAARALSTNPPPPLPYHVHRTASQNLPVYHLAKRGGNLHQTRVRKIEGDVERLRDEIRTFLGIKEEDVVINRLMGHIIIKVR